MPYWPVPDGTHRGERGDGALSLTTASTAARVGSGRRRAGWWSSERLEYLAIALLAYVPQLWARPGVADSDTKSYLYLDAGRFLRQSASMWDPTVGLGTVTHEQIGFLFPLGPFFWAVHALGIPLWIGQRLWVGSMLFGAGAGVLYLCRTVGLRGPGRFVAAAGYMLSPYWLQDVGRIGSLVLPWAGLGWMIAFVIRGVRGGGWRYPALFALVWLTVSGLNASGPVYAVVAPTLWLVYAVFIVKEHTLRQAWATVWRTALLTAGVSLWWAWALAIESGYGLNVLGVTEKVSAVAKTSLSSEVLRGLGYWFFYGSDIAGPWAATSAGFTQQLWLIGVTFAVPLLALVAAVAVRWRQRAFFIILVVVGMVLAVGSNPYAAPSTVGGFIKAFMTKTTAGLALRSTDRATPMVLLGLAILLGAGVTALAQRRRVMGILATGLALATIAAANPPAWNGSSVLDRYTFPTPVPNYVTAAATALNAQKTDTRVFAIPGDNFGAYTYGNTVDPIWPGLLTRPFVTRQQLPLGSVPSYDMTYAVDVPMQNRTADPAALAPMARLMSVGDILVQSDIAYGLYDRPPPELFWESLHLPQAGLSSPVGFGTPRPNVSPIPMVDESTLAASANHKTPAPLEVLGVDNPRPVVRAESTSGALLVAGDAVGLANAAGLGLLNTTSAVIYAGTTDSDHKALTSALAGGATLVVTDTNRKQPFLWNTVSNNAGITLAASDTEPNVALDIFPGARGDAQSTDQVTGVAAVTAVPDDPDHSADKAIDGIPGTAWETHLGVPPVDKFWQVTLAKQVTTGRITILQPAAGDYQVNQWITRATISFDGGTPITVKLGTASHAGNGQVLSFPRRTFTTLRIKIDATNLTGASKLIQEEASPVGLAEVGVAGARAQEVTSMPADLLSSVGTASQSHRLVLVMTRQRVAPVAPAADPEPVLARSFTLPTTRAFSLTGTARLSAMASDDAIDALVGRAGANHGGVVAYSSQRLPGDLAATASAALDGNGATMWSPGLGAGNQKGSWIEVNRPQSSTVDHLDLVVAADGHHSVPTRLRLQACDRLAADGRCPAESASTSVTLPAVADGHRQGATASIPVSFPAVKGRDLTVTVTGVRLKTIKGYSSQAPIALPLGIAELGIPGTRVSPAPATFPAACRSNLVTVDGTPLSVSLSGTTQGALAGSGLTVTPCGASARGLTLAAGTHVVLGTSGATTGLTIDQLALDSGPSGARAPTPSSGGAPLAAPTPGPTPTVRVTSATATKIALLVTGATRPYWLVLGQSINKGWKPTVAGSGQILGHSTLIDGFANGWLVQPTGAGTVVVTLRWTPQSSENIALVISALAAVVCVALALRPRRRRTTRGSGAMAGAAAATANAAPMPSTDPVASEDIDTPTLSSPFATARVVTPGLAAVSAAVCGLGAGVLVPQAIFFAVFLGVALGVAVAFIAPRARGLLGLAVVGFTIGAIVYSIVLQATQHFPSGAWPTHFEVANELVWTAIVFLGADAVVELVRRLRR
jgi:hypothetical protein